MRRQGRTHPAVIVEVGDECDVLIGADDGNTSDVWINIILLVHMAMPVVVTLVIKESKRYVNVRLLR